MSLEVVVILSLIMICIVLGTWSALVTTDSWDAEPVEGENNFGYHKATLGIHQPPGEWQWEKDLDALRMDQKHRLC
tara:strand:+ start:225 stop:452 length:228 start_codon:yes stop_codon:yes gene_type:complete